MSLKNNFHPNSALRREVRGGEGYEKMLKISIRQRIEVSKKLIFSSSSWISKKIVQNGHFERVVLEGGDVKKTQNIENASIEIESKFLIKMSILNEKQTEGRGRLKKKF